MSEGSPGPQLGSLRRLPVARAGGLADLALLRRLEQGRFEAALILTPPGRSPYRLAYLAYLAGVPIRAAQSLEWAGSALSYHLKPDLTLGLQDPASWHLELLREAFPDSSFVQSRAPRA